MSAFDNPLINGLGGTADFGENVLGRNDDSSTGFIDVTSVFESGLNFFGTVYNGFYINNNGNITFNSSTSTFTPFALTGNTGIPIIAPFFTDVDTRAGAVTPSPGGNSTGSNLVYWDLDTVSDTATITWDDVGEYSGGTTPNAFQIRLYDTGGGNFTTEFRYEDIQWNHGNARAGYSAADGTNFFELPQSGTSAILDVETASNVEQPGVFLFAVRNGVPNRAPTDITLSASSVDENNSNSTVIGTLTTTDPDEFDAHIYSLIDDAGGRFAINVNQLIVADGALLDYETNISHNIIIRTTDIGGSTYDESFTININDLNEPDLKVTAATAPTTASLGETFQVNWTVTNQGDGEALDDWVDSVYLSDDAIFDSSDRQLTTASITVQTPLAASGNYSQQVNVTIPDTTTTGNKYLLVVADSNNSQWEDKETNNVEALPIELKLPDLVVSNATAPTTTILNQPFAVSWTVTNQGDVQAPDDWYDYVYLSDDTTLDSSDTYLTQQGSGNQTPLAAQNSYTFTENINIADINKLGSRYLLFVTDRNNNQGETNETNNTTAVPIELTAPDLVVSNVTAATTATWGETVGVSWSVINQGTGTAPADWSDYIYLSADAILDENDTYLGSQTATAQTPLVVDGTYTLTQNITIPDVTPGSWYLLVKADSSTQQIETSETNNLSSVLLQVQAPDLVVSGAIVPATGILGEALSVSWTVNNQGTGAALADWSDYVYLSDDTTLDISDLQLGYKSAADKTPLAANGTYTQTLDLTLLNTTTGSKYLLFVTDKDNQQREVNESNNVLAQSIAVTAADLQVDSLAIPASATFGNSANLSWTVRNAGDGTAIRSWSDRLWLSQDAILSSDDILLLTKPADTIVPLASGSEYTQTASVGLPLTAELNNGNYFVLAQTDALGNQLESNEANNIFISAPLALTLPPLPDLVVSDIVAPVEGLSGQQIEISWTVTNQGNGDATGTWSDRVYFSNDSAIGGDQLFGDFSFSGTVAAGESVVRKQLITLPNDLNGARWVIVQTDAGNQLFEHANESNNTAVDELPIDVRLAPFPNLQVSSVTAPPTAFSGQQTVIEWTVTNTGTGATSSPAWSDSVLFSLDTTFDNTDTFLGSVGNASYLNVGDSYTNRLTVTLPQNIDNNYYFLVKTDSSNQVGELTNESDNFGTSAPTDVDLTPPADLQLTTVNAPEQAFSGQTMNLSWTVTNQGPGLTKQTAWSDAIYLSTNTVLDDGDVLLGQRSHTGVLNSGENYNATQNITLPIGVSGDFYFLVRTDFGNQVYEQAFESNNTSYDPTPTRVNLTPPPDLEVEFVNAPTEALASHSLTINYRVTNYGATATPNGSWEDSIYLSIDNQLDLGTDLNLGKVTHIGSLDIGASYDSSASFTLSNGLSGNYYAFVLSDSGNAVFELDNNNNVSFDAVPIAVSSRPADLVISTVDAPVNAEAGKASLISWTVTNQGIGDTAVNTWTDRVFASTDAVFSSDDVLLGSFTHNGLLNPGDFYSQSQLVTVPFNLVGSYHLFIATDTDSQVYEATGEDNNSFSGLPVTVTRQTPDLQTTEVTAPTTALSGSNFTVNWTGQNLGTGRTNANYWYDNVYLSQDQVISSDDSYLGQIYHSGAIEPLSQYNGSGTFKLPVDLTGNFYTLVRTDATDQVLEGSLENNNVQATTTTTTITLNSVPDLTVQGVDAPVEGISGQSFNGRCIMER